MEVRCTKAIRCPVWLIDDLALGFAVGGPELVDEKTEDIRLLVKLLASGGAGSVTAAGAGSLKDGVR